MTKDLYGGLFCYDEYMPKKNTQTSVLDSSSKDILRAIFYAILIIPGLFFAYMYWFNAGMSLCGISGCSGGGFGVSYDPQATQDALINSGIVAAIGPLIVFFISKFKGQWIIITFLTLVLVPIIGGMYIGAGFDGYPINRKV
ncbi:hypothetical protein D3C85_1139160 [compost metagenome]